MSVHLDDLNFLLQDASTGGQEAPNEAEKEEPFCLDENKSVKQLKQYLDACGEDYRGVVEKKELLRRARVAHEAGKTPAGYGTSAHQSTAGSQPMEVAPNQVASVAAQMGIDTGFVWQVFLSDSQKYQSEDRLKEAVVAKLRTQGFAPQVDANAVMQMVCDEPTFMSWQQLGNVQSMLVYLDRILWTNSGWMPVAQAEMCLVDNIKSAYKKAIRVTHPDKLPNDVDAGVKAFAARVFDTLKLSWDAFTSHEKMVKAHLEQQQEEAAQAAAE